MNTYIPIGIQKYCNGSFLEIKFLDPPHILLTTVKFTAFLYSRTPQKSRLYSHHLHFPLSQFHLSPLKSDLFPSTPWELLCEDLRPSLPNGKFWVFLDSISATFNRVIIPSLKSFLHLASDLPPHQQPPVNSMDPPSPPNL